MSPSSPVQLEIRPGPEAEMSVSDSFHTGRWVEQLWILRDRILDPADEWRHAPHLPWENADPESNPVKFEVANIDSQWSLSRSEAGFVGGILQQFTRSQESAFGYTFAASAWLYLGRHHRACAMLRRALAADPRYVPAYVIRAVLQVGVDDLPAGIRDLEEALAVNPNSVPALTAYAMFEPDFDSIAANRCLDRALRLAPNHAEAFVVRGVLAQAEGDEEAALSHLNRALDIDPAHAMAYQMRADIWSAMLEWPKVLDDLGTLRNLMPSNRDIRTQKMAVHLFLEQYREAEAEVTYFVDKYPDDPMGLLSRAQIRQTFKWYDGAIDDLNAAIEIDPELPDSYVDRGLLRHKMEEYDLALEDYARALAIDPGDTRALVNRGLALLETGQVDEAADCAQAILAIDKEDGDGLYLRGRVRIETGQYKRAVPDLNRVLRADPNDVEARSYRGLAREKIGNRKGARKDYARAYRDAVANGDEKGAAFVVKLFPDLKQHKTQS